MAPGGWGCTRRDPSEVGDKSGRTAPLPNDGLPSHAQGGKFFLLFLPLRGNWRGAATGSSFLSVGLTIVWAM